MKLSILPFLRNLDKIVAKIGVLFSLILIIFPGLVMDRFFFILAGVLTLISCLLWLTFSKGHTLKNHFPESRIQTTLCAICFFGLFALSILSIYFRQELYERPLIYFILTTLMAGAIAWHYVKQTTYRSDSFPNYNIGSKHRLVSTADFPEPCWNRSMVSLFTRQSSN